MPSTENNDVSGSDDTATVGASKTAAAASHRAHDGPRRGVRSASSAEATNLGLLNEGWGRIMDSQRRLTEANVLAIHRPRGKLDAIAEAALRKVCAALEKKAGKLKVEVECELRDRITDNGIASEVQRITQRLNARRMTDGRRWVLSETYPFLLETLFVRRGVKNLERLVADDLGVSQEVMLLLDARQGPVHQFASQMVKVVMAKNKISETEVFCERVSQQVRSAI